MNQAEAIPPIKKKQLTAEERAAIVGFKSERWVANLCVNALHPKDIDEIS
jgi:hypothetical protein